MEVKLTLSQIIIALLQIASSACTAIGIAYYFGRKFSTIETTVKYVVEKVEDVAEEVKTLSSRMWEDKNKYRGR